MTRSLRRFLLIAAIALGVATTVQTSAHAQHRRPIIVPRVNVYTNPNPYVLPGMTYSQYATLGALNPGYFPPANYGYYNPYRRPVYGPYAYPAMTYPPPVGLPALSANAFRYYNPYFASFGYYP